MGDDNGRAKMTSLFFQEKNGSLHKAVTEILWLNARLRGAWDGKKVHRSHSLTLHRMLELLP